MPVFMRDKRVDSIIKDCCFLKNINPVCAFFIKFSKLFFGSVSKVLVGTKKMKRHDVVRDMKKIAKIKPKSAV